MRGLFAASILLWLLAGASMAQTFRGTILGNVTDQSGAAVADAKVTIRNTGTGQVRETNTTNDGTYVAPELPLGTYTVTVEKAGFKTSVTNDVKVNVASETRVNAALQAGEVSTTVEVSGEIVPLVETTSDVQGGVIESSLAGNLPVNGRDYTKLIYLVPGVAGSPDQISDSPGSYGTFSLNGARGRVQQLPAGRHRHERRLPERSGHQRSGCIRYAGYHSSRGCRCGNSRAIELRA